MRPSNLTQLAAVLDRFADMAGLWSSDAAPTLTCDEADAIAALLATIGHEETARSILLRHLTEDAADSVHASRHGLPTGEMATSLSVLGGTGLRPIHAYVAALPPTTDKVAPLRADA